MDNLIWVILGLAGGFVIYWFNPKRYRYNRKEGEKED